jgi:hypothetical protein
MWKKIKVIWGILTGNMTVGYLSTGRLPDGRVDIMFTSYRPKPGRKVDYDKTIIIPECTIAYIPRLTEGRTETPEEYLRRTRGGDLK